MSEILSDATTSLKEVPYGSFSLANTSFDLNAEVANTLDFASRIFMHEIGHNAFALNNRDGNAVELSSDFEPLSGGCLPREPERGDAVEIIVYGQAVNHRSPQAGMGHLAYYIQLSNNVGPHVRDPDHKTGQGLQSAKQAVQQYLKQ